MIIPSRSFNRCLFLFLLLSTPFQSFSQEEIQVKKFEFEKGKSSTVIKGKIKGYQTIDYVINAKEGQTLDIKFTSSNSSNYFNLMAPGEDYVAFSNSSMDENNFHGILEKSGDQKIRVYLMRSAARRNETADFTLEISVKAGN
ncbi:hypothetical protein AAGF08_04385 [Algoriphagus sp. SE2]|uniref:hypothetical protein n=1 Tax=Algoriphagus sp. SE2 TaxID=3141536 RepID=UPI0031CD902C